MQEPTAVAKTNASGLTYAASGVDIDAGDALVERIAREQKSRADLPSAE
jgi:phosphoribosylaminoimidazole (AIR) synthetase